MEVPVDKAQTPTGLANGQVQGQKLWLESKDPSTLHLHTH